MKLNYTHWLIIINFVVFFAQSLATSTQFDLIETNIKTEDVDGNTFIINCVPQNESWDSGCDGVTDVLGLTTKTVFERGFFWQYFTYMFTHADFTHLFFNMFGLLVFGPKIERTMGKKKFLRYYLICGLGSSILYSLIISTFVGVSTIPMVGASGAIFGILTAFGILYPKDIIYVQFFIPMPAYLFVTFYGIIQLLYGIPSLFGPQTGGVAYLGHLGGMLTGIILLKYFGYDKRRIRYFWQ